MTEEDGLLIIMPAHNEAEYVKNTIYSIPKKVDLIIFVNDGSTDSTEKIAKDALIDSNWGDLVSKNSKNKFKIINQKNLGVGAAVFNGMKVVLNLEKNNTLKKLFPKKKKWIIIIMDADGQMDPNDIDELIKPIRLNSIDHVKGNRIGFKGMPITRRFGSFLLKNLMRFASGYNKINDPQCGYRAINLEMIKKWDFTKSWNDFGYTNWWLLESGRKGYKLEEVPIKSIFNDKKSKLRIRSFLPKVSLLIFIKLWERGIEWYIFGKGGTHFSTRALVSLFWIISLFSSAGVFLSVELWYFYLLCSIIGFTITKQLDNNEIDRRRKSGSPPIIN